MTARLRWGPDEVAEVGSIEQLDRLLDELTAMAQREGPFTVELAVDDQSTIGAVLGREESSLQFYSADQRPPMLGCCGPWDDDTLITFMHMGSYSELPRRYFVPIEEAREAIRRYFLTGVRPDIIQWC